MLPTINKKFLFKLVMAVVLLAGALFGTHAVQARRIPEALKTQAERAEQLSETDPKKADAAIQYFRQYLEFRGDDVDVQEKLAALLRARAKRTGSSGNLIGLYDKILLNDPDRHDTRREALKVSLVIGRFTDAETHAEYLLKRFPNDQALYLDLAYAQRGLQKLADARSTYETAIQADPTRHEAYQEYADFVYNEIRSAGEARAILDRLVSAQPKDAKVYTIRARFLGAVGNETAAIADAKTALALDAHNPDAMLMLGEQLQKRREDVAAAADMFRDGLTRYPTDIRFVRNLAWLEVNRGNNGAAVTVLEDGLTRASEKDRFDLLVPLTDLLLTMRDKDKPQQLIQKLQNYSGQTPAEQRTVTMQVQYLAARLAMSETRWSDAVRDLTKLRDDSGELIGLECQANLLLSFCQQRQGDFAAEEQTLKILLSRDPNHAAGLRSLGDAYLNAGRFDEAIAEYELAAKNRFATPDCRAKLLKMKAAKYRTQNASSAAWKDLEAQLENDKPTFGAGSDFTILRAELLHLRGQTDRALATLRTEALQRPTDARIWAIYAQYAADYAGVAPGLSFLDEAQAACGDRLELRLARATLNSRDPARLRPLDPLAAQIDLWPEGDQTRLLFGLVEVYDQMGDEAGVLRTFRRIAGRYPTEKAVWEGLFDRATRSGDAKTATEARQMLLKLDANTDQTTAMLNAWDVANAKRSAEAPAAIEALTAQFGAMPERSDICVSMARLHALNAENGRAGELFARAVQLDPVRFGIMQEYVQFLTATANDNALSQLVQRLGQDFRWRGEPLRRTVRQTVARVPAVSAKRLLDLVKPKIELEPDGAGWLGDCYRLAGFETDAKNCYGRAINQPTTTADDWLRLAVRSAEAKDMKTALETLKLAKSRLASPQLYLMTAAVFADIPEAPKDWAPELGTSAEKKLYAQARLALKLSRYQKAEAIAILEAHLNDKTLAPNDRPWARRNLAMLLASRGTTAELNRAKELLTGDDVTAGDNAEDKRSTAAVLAGLSRQLEGEDRDLVLNRAIKVLSEVVMETKNPRDKFLLSQLYRSSGNWAGNETAKQNRIQGRTLLQELIREDAKNVEYYVAALDEATEPADRAFAEKCAEFLIKNQPSDFRVVQAVARFECRIGEQLKAYDHIVAYSKSADATPGDYQTRSARTAELLDELSRKADVKGTDIGRKMTNTAVEKYESLFEFRPDSLVAMAGLLSNDQRSAEAFALIEKHAKKLPSRVRVLAGLAVLRAGEQNESHVRRIREWLAASKTEEPGSVAVLLNEGEFASLIRETDVAEKAYAEVLTTDDLNVVALNNLAWLLAGRPDSSDRALDLVEKASRILGLTGELLDTRARIRIAKKQYDLAIQDLQAALKQERTGLRLFHLALAQQLQSPAKTEEPLVNFREAVKRGLRETSVHTTDLQVYRDFLARK